MSPDVSAKTASTWSGQAPISTTSIGAIQPNGTEGYRTAAMPGGVERFDTMGSAKCPGLCAHRRSAMDVTVAGWGPAELQWAY